MKKRLPLLLVILCSLNAVAQQKTISFTGEILEFQKPIEGVHVLNLNKSIGTSTDKNGFFKIIVSLNDTLIISHVKYRTRKIGITDSHFQYTEPTIIYIEEMTNYLDTVTIKNHNLLGMLEADTKEVPKSKNLHAIAQDIIRSAKQPSYVTREYLIDQPKIPKPFINSVDPIQMRGDDGSATGTSAGIGFKYKDLEIRKKIKSKRNFPQKIISEFGKHYFTITLKIPEEKILHFLTYCDSRNIIDLYHKNKLVAVITILQEESIAYLKIKD